MSAATLFSELVVTALLGVLVGLISRFTVFVSLSRRRVHIINVAEIIEEMDIREQADKLYRSFEQLPSFFLEDPDIALMFQALDDTRKGKNLTAWAELPDRITQELRKMQSSRKGESFILDRLVKAARKAKQKEKD